MEQRERVDRIALVVEESFTGTRVQEWIERHPQLLLVDLPESTATPDCVVWDQESFDPQDPLHADVASVLVLEPGDRVPSQAGGATVVLPANRRALYSALEDALGREEPLLPPSVAFERTWAESITRAIEARTREDIVRSVPQVLTDDNLFWFAWLGLGDGEHFETVTAVGIDSGPSAPEPIASVIQDVTEAADIVTRDEATVPDTLAEGPIPDAADPAVVGIPVGKDGVDGVLVVGGKRTPITQELDEEALADLGHILGVELDATVATRDLTLFKEAAEQAGHAIYITDRDGEIQWVNSAFVRSTGYDASEAIGETPNILKSGEMSEEYYDRLWDTLLAGETWEAEIINRRKTGELYQVDQTISPIVREGEIEYFVAINNEITRRNYQNQQLQVLYRVLRHNLRNDINVIRGQAELLPDSPESVKVKKETIVSVADDLTELGNLVNEVKNTATIDALPTEGDDDIGAVDVTKMVRENIRTCRSTYEQATITVDLPNSALIPGRVNLQPAVRELIDNAVEHSDQAKPTVSLVVDRPLDPDGWVQITVADDGPGIPDQERVVLETGEESPLMHGSGVGLWLVNWLVTAAGGAVEIEDNEPRGTVVTLKIPYAGTTESASGECT